MGVIRNDLHITRFPGGGNRLMIGILRKKNAYSFFSDRYKTPVHAHFESTVFKECLK